MPQTKKAHPRLSVQQQQPGRREKHQTQRLWQQQQPPPARPLHLRRVCQQAEGRQKDQTRMASHLLLLSMRPRAQPQVLLSVRALVLFLAT